MERARLKPEDQIKLREQIIKLASESENWIEVARKLGWSHTRLYYWRKVLDIDKYATKMPITKDDLEKAFKDGKTVSMVSKETGISYSRIRRMAQRWGLPMPPSGKSRMWLRGRNRKEIGLEIRRLSESGKTMTEIASELDVPYSVVYYEVMGRKKKSLNAQE